MATCEYCGRKFIGIYELGLHQVHCWKRPKYRERGWHGESRRHSLAAIKGKRKKFKKSTFPWRVQGRYKDELDALEEALQLKALGCKTRIYYKEGKFVLEYIE